MHTCYCLLTLKYLCFIYIMLPDVFFRIIHLKSKTFIKRRAINKTVIYTLIFAVSMTVKKVSSNLIFLLNFHKNSVAVTNKGALKYFFFL